VKTREYHAGQVERGKPKISRLFAAPVEIPVEVYVPRGT
jgi:hypothetical protein